MQDARYMMQDEGLKIGDSLRLLLGLGIRGYGVWGM